MALIREKLEQLEIAEVLSNEEIVDDMLAYFQRREDHSQIREAIKSRYGLGIKQVDNPANDTATLEVYTQEGFNIQVDAGMVETLCVGFGHKITAALATLFTEPGQRFTLVHPDENTDVTDSERLIQKHRKRGGFKSTLTLSDRSSVQVGSAALFMEYTGSGMKYHRLVPSDIRAYYADTIMDNGPDGEAIERQTDKCDVEDASIVVVRLGRIDSVTYKYLAIFGRQEEYPKGRYVTYSSDSGTTKIPKFREGDSIDYLINGEPANPLSYIADQYNEFDIPEYPIAIISGGTTEDNVLMPISASLYADSIEFDSSGSHLLGTSGDAARGTTAITRNAQAIGKPLPRTTRGQIALHPGQGVEHISHSASDSVDALKVHSKLMTEAAVGYSVPDYMVVSEDHALDASSGIALQVKTRPLKKQRELRAELAEPSIEKIFQIEKYLISFYDPTAPGAETLKQCEQIWDVGELQLPENKKEKADRIIALMDKGILDTIAGLREYYNLATDEEAIEIYLKMQERAGEFPPLVAASKKTVGLLGNANA